MTKPMLTATEEALLRKRNIIETVFSRLKNWDLVYTKIRSYCGCIHIGKPYTPPPKASYHITKNFPYPKLRLGLAFLYSG